MRRSSLTTFGLLILGLAPVLPAQKPAKPQTEISEKARRAARALLESWEARRYHMGRAGVRRLRCKIKVVSRGGMTGKWAAQGSYEFGTDPKKLDGVLRWDDEEVARAMTRRGWTAEVFARELRLDALRVRLRGKDLNLVRSSKGQVVTLTDTKNSRGLIFDKQGLLLGEVIDPLKKRIRFETREGKLLRVAERYQMPDTIGEVRIRWRKHEGRLLLRGFDERVMIRGRLHSDMSLRLHGYEVNFDLERK